MSTLLSPRLPRFFSNTHFGKLEDLSSTQTLTLSNFNKRTLVFKNGHEETSLQLKSGIVCNSPDVLLSFTLLDLGVGFLPESMCRDYFKTGQLIRLFEGWRTQAVTVSALFHASGRKTTPVSLFIAFLANHFDQILTKG